MDTDSIAHQIRYHTAAIRQYTDALIAGDCVKGGYDEQWDTDRAVKEIAWHRRQVDKFINALLENRCE